jgi:glycerol-3-phosphate dehydrogenase
MIFEHIAIVGAGAWGTALANVIARTGRPVLLTEAAGSFPYTVTSSFLPALSKRQSTRYLSS